MDLVRDPYTGKMVDRRTGLPMEAAPGNVTPERVNYMDRLLNGTGVSERIMAVHSLFNPVTALAEAGQQSQIMLDPATNPMGRVAALGGMLTGMAGTVAPMYAASRGAVPTTNAMVDAMTGINMPGGEFLADEFGGIRLWHGSPHDFDKFDMGKIGTGEGAQAYGHGLYFGEDRAVGESFKDSLAQTVKVDGKPILVNNRTIGSTGDQYIDDVLIANNGDLEAAIAEETAHATAMGDRVSRRVSSGDPWENVRKLEALRGRVEATNTGRLYEVDVNANPQDFMDWDAPVSAQPPKVQDALKARWGEELRPEDKAKMFYLGEGQKEATERMRAAGVPGIKFENGGSRNYVVFDENLIEIVKKYGIAGAAAMLGVTAMDVEQAMAGAP